MFGYLFLTKELLSMAEKKIYRNYFCTLCLAHKYRYGNISILFNNYDLGVFSIILDLYGDKIEDCGRCGKYVRNKREKFSEKKWGYLVDYNINLVRKKLEDDLDDNPNFHKRVKSLGAKKIFEKCKQNNHYFYNVFDVEFMKYMAIESSNPNLCVILDAYETFARKTFGVLAYAKKEQINLFASINRWLYWIDAINDYDEDIKYRNYNPFVRHGRSANKPQFLENNMLHLLDAYEEHKQAIVSTYSKCSFSQESSIIIENIIFHSIRNTTKPREIH